SRVRKLAAATPSALIVFDLLVDDRGRSLVELPLSERRARLERFAGRYLDAEGMVRLSPATPELGEAVAWFERVGSGLDGIIAKRRDLAYQSGERGGMLKIKNRRTADCVVGGFRYASAGGVVG